MTDLSENGQVQPPSIESPKRDYSRRHYILIVLSGFMLNFTACGVVFAYGVYQAEYEAMATRPGTPFTGASSAEITLIGSLSSAMMKLGAPFVVAWCKCFSPRIVVCVGGLVFGVANILASFGTASWHFQLSQGLLLGIGSCLSYMPSMIVPPTWFSERRGLALGIISAGTGIGGLVFAPVIQACISALGFRNTLRLVGCLSTLLICASGAVLYWEPRTAGRLREEAASKSLLTRLCRVPLPPWALVRSRKFVAQLLNAAFQSAAYYTPVYYISSYGQTLGYSESEGANWTSLSNACNAIGKVAVGYLADYLGRLNSFFGVTLLSAVGAVGLWIPSTLLGGSSPHELPAARACFIVFTVLYGLFASAYIGLFSPALVELFGLEEMPRITGIMYMVQGAAGLVGTPVAGLLVRTSHGETTTPRSYLDMAIFVGALMVASTLAVAWVRVEQGFDRVRGRRSWVWKL